MKESRNWRGKGGAPPTLDTRKPRPAKTAARTPPAPRREVDLELLAALRAWSGPRRGEVATDEALGVTERGGRFRLKGALDRVFRHYGRLTWLLERAGAKPGPESLWGAASVVLDGLDPDAIANAIAVTTADIRNVAKTFGRMRPEDLQAADMPEQVKLECPAGYVALFEAAFGPRLKQELMALNLSAPTDIRANTLKAQREAVAAKLAETGMETRPTPYAPQGLRAKGGPDLPSSEAFGAGLFDIQDEGSQLVALLVDAKPGQQVLDFCAGAGGKTLALSAAMANKGHLVAADTSQRRLTRAKLRLKRAGAENAERVVMTGRDDDPFLRRRKGWFDRVLVDAPCSGTGAWRRHPEAKWQSDHDLARLTLVQDSILERASNLVKPGGRLIYATCSLLPAENEDRVTAFLERHPGFRLTAADAVWRALLAVPWPCLEPDYLKLTPAQHGTDGFFAAVLERTS